MEARRVVSFGRVIPYSGIDHAGGEYVHRLYRAMRSEGHIELVVVAPATERNQLAARRVGHEYRYLIVGRTGRIAQALANLITRVLWHVNPTLPDYRLLLSLLLGSALRTAVRSADVVDLQWAECGVLGRLVRRINPRCRIILTMHDVLREKYERRRDAAPNALTRARWKRAVAAADRTTRSGCAVADRVVVFSGKDARLVRAYGRGLKVDVVAPPLAQTGARSSDDRLPRDRRHVLFVGAMNRVENEDAATWLLTEIWPRVVAAVPEAHLTIAGARPSTALVELGKASQGVSVTGYVQSLDDLYDDALVLVVPLRAGAGVKFKTIEGLLHGCAVVATSIGAEGAGTADLYWRLADGADELADGVVSALKDPGAADERGRRARAWASRQYSQEAFVGQVADIYGLPLSRGDQANPAAVVRSHITDA